MICNLFNFTKITVINAIFKNMFYINKKCICILIINNNSQIIIPSENVNVLIFSVKYII